MRARSLRGVTLGAVLSLVGFGSLDAQTVVGYVLEEGTRRPLGGAFIVLEDASGTRHGAVLAGDDGRFVIRASEAGEYRLVTRLIGYADTFSGDVRLAAGETIERTLEVSIQAVSLEGIRAEVGKRCHGRPVRGTQTAQLWEEAKKALEIAEWGEEQNALRFHIVEHRRELDAASLRVIGMEEAGRRGFYDRSPYRSRPAEELAGKGYIQPAPEAEGHWDHFAPDAEVLLSSSFLDTHCFQVHAADEPDRVGLAFEPVIGRELPDIAGVLWLNRATAELERLDFRYVNLPYPHGSWPQVGGTVDFERLATGMWIVRHWGIRMPLTAARTGGFGDHPSELTLRTLSEEGARVTGVRTRGGEVLAEAAGATLYGVVESGDTREALAGATVEIPAMGRRATAGPDGVYRFTGLPSGTFQVEVTHEQLEMLGAGPVVREVRLEEGRSTRLAVDRPLKELAREFCGRDDAIRDPVVLYGFVHAEADGAPVPGAVVRVFSEHGERRAAADVEGRYAHCFDRSASLEVAAAGPTDLFGDPAMLERVEVRAASGVLARADLTVRARSTLATAVGADGPRRSSSAMIGTVIQAEDRSPIAGAMVVVRDPDGNPVFSGATNEDGRFRFAHPELEIREWQLSVEHVAYGKAQQTLEFAPGEQLQVEVALADHAIELAPIVVTERRRGLLVDVGFYDRVQHGAGIFVERSEIDRRAPRRVTDLLQGRSGVRVVQTDQTDYDIRVGGQMRVRGDCQPAIWLDGVRARMGGEPRIGMNKEPLEPQLSDIVPPNLVEAIEVYTGPAGLPMQYGGSDAMCGVVLIWTRRQ